MKSMLEKAAAEFPGALAGFTARIDESHQSTKKDKSGTAIAIGKNLAALGVAKVGEADIIPIRDRKEQLAWGVPENALDGHGWHNYRLTSEDESVTLGFVHNVNGRQTYVDGTMRALDFLVKEFEDHNSIGQCYSMIDVMRG
jgi:4-hydroxy-tetrahydrodipicolinate reductase